MKDGENLPITQIDIAFGDEAAPEGFERLKQSFNSDPSATFCVERAADKAPITDIKITYDDTRELILHSPWPHADCCYAFLNFQLRVTSYWTRH